MSTVRVGIAETATEVVVELSTTTVERDYTAIGVADELSIVIVMVGNDSTFSEGIDYMDTEDVPSAVVVPSAFALLELLVLLLLPDLLHIVSTKPRIITKNTCHSLSFHIISSLLRLKKTHLKPYNPHWATHFLIWQMMLKIPPEQYWFLSLKCYSDWCLGTIQNA